MNKKTLIFLSFLFILSFFLNLNKFDGNKLIFFIFNLSSYFLIITSLRKKATAFEFFLFIMFALSFWMKFSYLIFTGDLVKIEGDIFDAQQIDYDKIFIIISVIFSACIFSSYFREIVLSKFIVLKTFDINAYFNKFYINYRFYIIFFILLYLLIIYFTNFHFKIHIKGLISKDIPILIKYFFSWNFTYGLSVTVATFIYIDYLIIKKKKIFIFSFFESFFSSISILSRASLLILIPYLRGFWQLDYLKIKKKNNIIFLVILIIITLLFFFISLFSVSKMRSDQYLFSQSNKIKITSQFSVIKDLSIKRWVGIDGLVAVFDSDKLNFDFFKKSFSEKRSNKKLDSFYINNFFKKIKKEKRMPKEKKNLQRVVTPGIIAFLYYSGSLTFVCIALSFFILIFSMIENLFLKISCGNMILSNIIGFSLAYRLIHFGYLPYNTINFLFSYIITFIIIYLLSRLIWKIK